VDQSYAEIGDKVARWMPWYSEPDTTIRQLLSHTALSGEFQYDPVRFGALTGVVDECARGPKYSQLLASDFFDRLAMFDSSPGLTFSTPTSADTAVFDAGHLARYADVIRRLAVPYRVVNRRPTRNVDPLPSTFDIAQGVAASARDLARFDIALDKPPLVLTAETRSQAMSQSFSGSTPLRTGLGWFVQAYNNELIVWQFGVVEGAYSSLIIKVPGRNLTLILLANSDGLTAPFGLERGDVTTSIFARTFLRTFIP
jgi:CubicO group peptidase (beta-lactamase class C family)